MKTLLLLAFVFISASSCSVGSGFRFQHTAPAIAMEPGTTALL
ncbi:hypothetical protein [Pseudomonas nitroreducens]|nr:hypothetical protein [Pseudomonas nitroreducens]MCP1646708.1 hypothetical protein [Pseudomonas nitroreducens]MCP1685284.1 hypothetical protein [Pseudomonas nitroreducens]